MSAFTFCRSFGQTVESRGWDTAIGPDGAAYFSGDTTGQETGFGSPTLSSMSCNAFAADIPNFAIKDLVGSTLSSADGAVISTADECPARFLIAEE